MSLSAPIYVLKRKAKQLSRASNIPLHDALDRIAVQEGFTRWSLLAAHAASVTTAAKLFARLTAGDLLLIGARPGQGKTLLSLQLAVEAMQAGRRSAYFTLEYGEREVASRFNALGVTSEAYRNLFTLDCSDAISADHIILRLMDAPAGTLVVVDYLQILDQDRSKPPLAAQVQALRTFARERGLLFVFVSQIDRSFDPDVKPCPDVGDVRLPNPLDLSLFSKTCFLHGDTVCFT
ncbi:DNA helicase [Hyphomicrobium sulfonivorans]|uniref:DNA helicase n=1 Tax=Hyphomicrobium sulfonivorans TaxID=121290 RepID=UPI0015713E99|nr:AAA family ATPase [Hyphomicrobium sulfonivorans]NSL72228.1 DNA helicase [Hyphomicrobium sulfonivorans]